MSVENGFKTLSLTEQADNLSNRAKAVAIKDTTNPIWEVLNNVWHPENNPDGYVSLGVAENALMHHELEEHIRTNIKVPLSAFTYGDGPLGSKRLRKAIAQFLNKYLKPIIPIEMSHVVSTNGVSHAIEHCSWAFANPGDGFLLGQPYYGAFIPDIALRPGVEVLRVQFGDLDPVSVEGVSCYETAIAKAQERGVKVRGLMLCSPHNPLGRCYSKETIIELMKLCQRHQIHFVSDEIYAFSVWENKEDTNPPPVPFTSAFSIDLSSIIEPNLVHVLWGVSKDFGANGLRTGCIISQSNRTFHTALQNVSIYSYVSSVSDHIVANILEDDVFTTSYIKMNQQRLSEAYSFVVAFLRKNNISYAPGSNAAFFLWMDLGKAYIERHPARAPEDITNVVMKALLDHKVFLASGTAFGSEKPGIFRLVFSQPRHHVEEALRRITAALED